MNYEEIKKLMDDMGESKLDSLEIEFPDGIKISMTKSTGSIKKVEKVGEPQVEREVVINKVEKEVEEKNQNEDCKIIKSPMVGTFYASSSPTAESFVKVGDKVSKGQVVCIVEAMKLMNEIESEYDGEIIEVCATNGEMVEFGMPLFKIR